MDIQKEIGVPLSAILELHLLANTKVLAGKAGLSRVVTSVNVLEVPDILDWVSHGQLLITTAYPYKNNTEMLGELIPRLHKAGVAGIGIKPKRYINEVPDNVLEIADRLAFPIVEVPQEISFSEIITAALTLVMDRQTRVLEEIHALHQSLTRTMLSGGNLSEICGILYQRFENSVAISSDFFSSFAINTSPEKYPYIYNVLQTEKQAPHIQEELPGASVRTKDMFADTPYERIKVPIYSDQVLFGHIYIWEDIRAINNLELSAIESVTSLIALDITKKISMLEMENSHKSGFLDDLLSSDSRRQQKALSNARLYDFNPKAAHTVAVVRPCSSKNVFRSAGKTWFRLNTNLVGILQRQIKSNSFKILYVNNDSSLVMLCEMPGIEDSATEIRCFMQNLAALLGTEYLEGEVSIGVGRMYEETSDLYKSYAEARRAVNCSHMEKGNLAFFEDLGACRLLAYDSIRQEGKAFCDEVLRPLMEYDEENDGELVKTLAAYFDCGNNLTQLAERLGVHYNTAVYRMQQIRKLTGCGMDKAAQVMDFRVALLLHEMWNYG